MTTQVRLPCGGEDASSVTAHLSSPGGRASRNGLTSRLKKLIKPQPTLKKSNTQRGAPMFGRVCLTCIVFLFSGAALTQSQTPNSAINYFEHGNKKYDRGDLDGAITDFTRAIEISSHPAFSKLDRNRLAAGGNAFSDSDDPAGNVNVIDPFTAQALISRGLAFLKKGDVDHALADFDHAIRINPGFAEAYVDRGGVRYAQGDTERALADWNKAIRLNSKLAAAYLDRGALFIQMGKIDAACADLDKAIALDRKEAKAYGHRGFAWMLRKDFDRAISDFNMAISLDSRLAWLFDGRGSARMARNELEPAIADFDQALQLDPGLAVAYMNRGLVLLFQGKEAEATRDFEHALAINPDLKGELNRSVKSVSELRAGKK